MNRRVLALIGAAAVFFIGLGVMLAGSVAQPGAPDPLERELPAIRAAMQGIRSFTLHSSRADQGQGPRIPREDEFAVDIANQQMRWTSVSTPTFPVTMHGEEIWIGLDHYIRPPDDDPSGKWRLVRDPAPVAQDAVDFLTHNGLIPPDGLGPRYEAAGTETIGGMLCQVYHTIDPTRDPSGFGHSDSRTYWVGVQDKIVYQSVTVLASEAAIQTEHHTLRAVNAPLAITPPPPETVVTPRPAPTPAPTTFDKPALPLL